MIDEKAKINLTENNSQTKDRVKSMSKNSGVKTSSNTRPDLELDVAIIGAGVSGLYTGWRLLTGENKKGNGARPRVHVLEASHRIGGRLETLFMEGMPHVRAEFGGMRYLSSHLLVANLVNFLGLRNTFFPMGDGNNLFYLRGKRFRKKELAAATKSKRFPYRMARTERGMQPYDLFNAEFLKVFKAGGMQPPNTSEQWNYLKENLMYKGRHIYDVGFWNMLLDEMSNEGFNYVADAGGYYSNIVNGGAGEGMEEIMGDFSSNPTYLTLEDGYDQIPIALANQFKRYGGEIWEQNRLLKLERARGGKIKAHIENWKHKKWTITARHVVLGMPRRSLELLDPTSFIFESEQLRQDITTVIKEPAFKLFMGYTRPWWRDAPLYLHSGEAVTDLPIRQSYYFGTECEQAGGEPGNTNSLMMSGYNDMWAMYFWKGLELKDQEALDLEGDPTRRKRLLRSIERDEGTHNPYRMRPHSGMKGKSKPLSAAGEGPGIRYLYGFRSDGPLRADAVGRDTRRRDSRAIHRGIPRLVARPLRRGLSRLGNERQCKECYGAHAKAFERCERLHLRRGILRQSRMGRRCVDYDGEDGARAIRAGVACGLAAYELLPRLVIEARRRAFQNL